GARARREGACVHPGPPVRHPGGCEERRARCPPPQARAELRSRCRADDCRSRDRPDSRRRSRPLMMWFSKPPTPRRPVTRRVRDLEIASARLLRAGFAGDYQSAFHGRGIEFSQVREYQPGDDIRTIDWNVTARHGTPFVKEFVEERDLTIIVVVDVSASMAFGSADWRKADLAAELTAIFAFSAVQNADRAGLLLFSDGVRTFIPPRRGHPHAQLIVRTAADAAM